MEEKRIFTEEDVQRLREEFRVPKNVDLNLRRVKRLYLRSIAKEILGHDPHPLMKPDDDKEETWKVLINKKLLPCCDGSVPVLDIPCSVEQKGIVVVFHGTIDSVLHQLYAIANHVKEKPREQVLEEPMLA